STQAPARPHHPEASDQPRRRGEFDQSAFQHIPGWFHPTPAGNHGDRLRLRAAVSWDRGSRGPDRGFRPGPHPHLHLATWEVTMRNSMSASALSEFVNEVRERPEEGALSYGVHLTWESGTRSQVEAKTMTVGPHRVSRSFRWKVDEPRQLLGTNHAPNPQEYLLSGLGACIAVSFLAGASAMGIQVETLEVEV